MTMQPFNEVSVGWNAPNQLQMQTFVVFSALMKGMGVYLLSVDPNEAEYAARFIRNECGQVNYVFELHQLK